MLIDFHEQQLSQEACSVYVREDSNPSLLFSNELRNFPFTEQSKALLLHAYEDSDSEDQQDKKPLLKVKSEGVLPRKKKEKVPKEEGK